MPLAVGGKIGRYEILAVCGLVESGVMLAEQGLAADQLRAKRARAGTTPD